MRSQWHKYKAKRTTIDGITFPSKHEAEIYQKLAILKKAGKIKGLQMQFPLGLKARNAKGREYVHRIDFMTTELDGSHRYIEAKGMDLPMGKFKRALVKYFYGIDIEVM